MREGTTGTNPTLSANHTSTVTAQCAYLIERALRAKPYSFRYTFCGPVLQVSGDSDAVGQPRSRRRRRRLVEFREASLCGPHCLEAERTPLARYRDSDENPLRQIWPTDLTVKPCADAVVAASNEQTSSPRHTATADVTAPAAGDTMRRRGRCVEAYADVLSSRASRSSSARSGTTLFSTSRAWPGSVRPAHTATR